jgi:hypothetical protein
MTCDPLLSFSKEGRTAPAAACSAGLFFVAAADVEAFKSIGDDGTECSDDAASNFLSTSTTANGRLAGRGIAGAV